MLIKNATLYTTKRVIGYAYYEWDLVFYMRLRLKKLMLEPTSQAQWHSLVKDAMASSGIVIDAELECYLVLLLIRFTAEPELLTKALALDYLQSHHEVGALKRDILRDVGDKCLLFSGLFPGQALRKRTRISYFVTLGQSAYGALAGLDSKDFNHLYSELREKFVPLMDVLLATRTMHGDLSMLTPLEAQELWSDTGSHQAYRVLQHVCKTMPSLITEVDLFRKLH